MSNSIRTFLIGMAPLALLSLGAQVHAQATDVDCSGCVNTSDIASQAVTTQKIQPNAVTSGKIRTGAVTTDKIASRAVTTQKIQPNAVTSGKIKDGAVTVDKVVPELKAAIGTFCPPDEAVVGMDASGNWVCEPFTGIQCDSATDVKFERTCYYLDGSNGVCQTGDVLAPQSILNSIAPDFVGKTYKTTISNNCCIEHADTATEFQDWGMTFPDDCNMAGPFTTGPILGGAGCTDLDIHASQQLTLCKTP